MPFVWGCGSEPDTSEPDPDPQDQSGPACGEFEQPGETISEYPRLYAGSLELDQADIQIETETCANEIAPFGVETPGPDQVVALTGLEPGQAYFLRLYSKADLAMYVATGCDVETAAPTRDSCILFVDGSVQSPERGSFVAPDSGSAFIVIDYFQASTPADPTFELEVYAEECSENSECGTGYCVDSQCVPCITSFDCTEADQPVCDSRTNQCVGGDETCDGDEPNDGNNDGPAGGIDVTPAPNSSTSANAAVCNAPTTELDFFQFTVEENGEHYSISVDWTGSDVDLELNVYGPDGFIYAASLWGNPEVVDLTYLPAGTYYAAVDMFAGTELTTAVPYTVTATRTTGETCESAADCAAEFDTQLFRSSCNAGACAFAEDTGDRLVGESCDTAGDCESGYCSNFSFTADADERSVCTTSCSADSECGEGMVCTDYLFDNICVSACENDLQCAVLLGTRPTEGSWMHLSCDTDTGRCLFPE